MWLQVRDVGLGPVFCSCNKELFIDFLCNNKPKKFQETNPYGYRGKGLHVFL